MDLEIGLRTRIDGLSLEEVVFRGEYARDDRAAFTESCGLLGDLLRLHDPDAVLLNLLGVDRIQGDDLRELAEVAIGASRPRGSRLCAIAVRTNWTIVSSSGAIVHDPKMPGLLSCGGDRGYILNGLKERLADRAAEPPGTMPVYFPDGSLDANPWHHEHRARWFSKHLWRMREPSFFDLSRDPGYHGYRFLWLRSFDAPVCVRIEIGADGSGSLASKMTSGQGGYLPGRLVVDKTRRLPSEAGKVFLEHLEKLDFWRAEIVCDASTAGLDGAEWILEGAKGGSYHVADQWCPQAGAFRVAALFLVGLSELSVGKIY